MHQAVQLARALKADAVVTLLDEGPLPWPLLQSLNNQVPIIVVGNTEEEIQPAAELGLNTVALRMEQSTVLERLTQALLEGVADELLAPSALVVVAYSGIESGAVDTVSVISLQEHLGRLTARDLRRLETSVPLETLRLVVDLAVDIGREGREAHPIGTLFVVGDTRRVLQYCRPAGFDPVRGYKRSERNLRDPRTREAIKEIAALDGAIIVSADGTVERACQIIQPGPTKITLSKGLGARHVAAASISRATRAVAVAVSQSSGTVRLFQHGEVVLRIEPLRRAMKWVEFEYEPPGGGDGG